MSIHDLAGQTLSQYELRELLGIGGMGAVYRAYQSSLKREVAVKVLTPQLARQPGYVERFTREAETAASLEHRHIVPIYDYGTQRDTTFVVMRLLTGGTLADRIARHTQEGKPLPSLQEIADVLGQIASALDYAHSKGVIHRDIKPSNVMFDNQGGAYLVDFGIAKLIQSETSLTASGMVVGTWAYMSPEQWRAEELTPAADQYALGIMTYSLITGRLPFEAPTPPGLMHKHLNEVPTPPQTFRANVPRDVTQVLERALAKKAKDRFPTATAFAKAFEEAIQGAGGESTRFFTATVRPRPPAAPVTPGLPWIADRLPASSIARSRPPVYKSPVVWGLFVIALIVLAVLVGMEISGNKSNKTDSSAQTAIALGATALRETEMAGERTETPLTPTISAGEALLQSATALSRTEAAAPSNTPVLSATHAGIVVLPGAAPSPTDTQTWTPIPTSTPTTRPTDTATWTPIPTSTPTTRPTDTATWTPTPTPTATATPTWTPIPTQIPILTPTATPSPRPVIITVTPSSLPSDTPVPSLTPASAPPRLDPIPDQVLIVGQTLRIDSVSAVDVGRTGSRSEKVGDENIVTLRLEIIAALPDGSARYTYTLTAGQPGTTTVTITERDDLGQKTSVTFTVTVLAPTLAATSTPAPGGTPVAGLPVISRENVGEIAELSRLPYAAYDLAFSPDGDRLAVAGVEGQVTVAEPLTGVVQTQFDVPGRPRSVAFIPDGSLLATGNQEYRVYLWNAETGQQDGDHLFNHTDEITSVAFSPNGKVLASAQGGMSGVISLWDMRTRDVIASLVGHSGPAYRLAFSANGKTLVSCGWDGTVRLWSPEAHLLLRVIQNNGHGPALSLALSADSRLAVGYEDGTIRAWELADNLLDLWPVQRRDSLPVHSLAISPDGSLLATGSDNGMIRLWAMDKGLLLREFSGAADSITSLVFSPDGQQLASASGDSVAIWGVSTAVVAQSSTQISGEVVHPTASLTATSTGTPEPVESADNPVVIVQSSTINLRSGPGTNYDVVGSARQGDRLPVIARSDNWYLVRQSDEQQAWVYEEIVELSPGGVQVEFAVTIPPSPPPLAVGSQVVYHCSDQGRLWAEPRGAAGIVEGVVLRYGQTVMTIIGGPVTDTFAVVGGGTATVTFYQLQLGSTVGWLPSNCFEMIY